MSNISKITEARLKYKKEFVAKKYFITVDPGARQNGGTGIVLWSVKEMFPVKIHYFSISSKAEFSYEMRVNSILSQISNEFVLPGEQEAWPIPVFIEKPQFFDSDKGLLSAKSDSLVKLAFCYGVLWAYFTVPGITYSVSLAIPHWKGQLSDEQVKVRVEKFAGYNVPKSLQKADVYSALGMGFWLKGVW